MTADRGEPMTNDSAGPPGQALECQTCPLCAGLAALRGARPEAVEHLLKAGAELLLAVRALLDAGPPDGQDGPRRQRRRQGGAAGDGLQRIDIG
jgi:hypothetical protein